MRWGHCTTEMLVSVGLWRKCVRLCCCCLCLCYFAPAVCPLSLTLSHLFLLCLCLLSPFLPGPSDGALLVYDITDEQSFKRVQEWVKELRKMLGEEIVIAIAGEA